VAIAVTLFSISPDLLSPTSDATTSTQPVVDSADQPIAESIIIESNQTANLGTTCDTVLTSASAERPSLGCEVKIFASTFITIFLAELGDKTQLTTLLMSAESQSPWVVFAGAGVALICTSLLGILLGRWLATKVSPKTLEISAGLMLLLIAATLFWDILSA
jgi:putative Ca2+/H+ antiporter (TMEM165/GDT1 family)